MNNLVKNGKNMSSNNNSNGFFMNRGYSGGLRKQ